MGPLNPDTRSGSSCIDAGDLVSPGVDTIGINNASLCPVAAWATLLGASSNMAQCRLVCLHLYTDRPTIKGMLELTIKGILEANLGNIMTSPT